MQIVHVCPVVVVVVARERERGNGGKTKSEGLEVQTKWYVNGIGNVVRRDGQDSRQAPRCGKLPETENFVNPSFM